MIGLKKESLIVFSLFFSFFLSLSTAIAQPSVCDWRGYIEIDGTLANSSYVITSYTNGGSATNGTMYSDGYYIVHVPGTSGNNVSFQVSGVYVRANNVFTNTTPLTWSCGGVGYNVQNLTMNKTANGVSCTYALGCSGGYCNSGVCASSPPAAEAPSAGAAPSAAPSAVVEVKETKTISAIYPTAAETVILTQTTELKLEKITINVKNAVSNVQVAVKESSLASLPSGTSAPITSDKGTVLKYLEITKTNLADQDVNNITIQFRVEKSWVTTNDINKSAITLQRLVGTTWNKLPTTLKEETDTLYKFEAVSSGLSFFSITGEKKVVAAPAEVPPVAPPPTEVPPVARVPEAPVEKPPTYIWIISALAAIAVIVYFLYQRRILKF